MHLLICLVLCFWFFFQSVTCDCDKTIPCDLQEWIVTDCDPCCVWNASPLSAVQKRSLCCPHGDTLALCMTHCNFTHEDVEQKGDCKAYCQPNCTGGFHFATTTVSTTTSTTATTPLTTRTPTTTTTSTTPTPTTTTTPPTRTLTATTTTTAQTSTVASSFHPVYLSSVKKPFDKTSCTTRNNHLKAEVPLLIWLPLLGILVGAVATGCLFWISRRKHRKVTGNTKTSGERNARAVPMFETVYGRDVNMSITTNRRTPNAFGNNFAF